MLRRVLNLLSMRRNQEPVQGSVVPPNWTDLPTEMRQEVAKKMSFPDRMRLRVCSRTEQGVVDSTSGHIPVLVFMSQGTTITVIFVHQTDNVQRVDISKKQICKLVTRTVIQKSDNIDGHNSTRKTSKTDYSEHLEKLFASIAQRNVSIGTVNISMENKDTAPEEHFNLFTHLVENFFETIRRNGMRKPRIVFSGEEVFETPLRYLGIDEVKSGLTRSKKSIMYIRNFPVKPKMGIEREVMDSLDFEDDLSLAIYYVMDDSEKPRIPMYLLPKFSGKDLEKVCELFSGIMEVRSDFTLIWIHKKHIMVKINKCGVIIAKYCFPGHEKEYEPCRMGWICANCDKTVESWYFRKFYGME